jgi:hypothetical protein
MEEQNHINFTHETFMRFVKARNKAVLSDKNVFMFDENEIMVQYADYIIEYVISHNKDIQVCTHYISKN